MIIDRSALKCESFPLVNVDAHLHKFDTRESVLRATSTSRCVGISATNHTTSFIVEYQQQVTIRLTTISTQSINVAPRCRWGWGWNMQKWGNNLRTCSENILWFSWTCNALHRTALTQLICHSKHSISRRCWTWLCSGKTARQDEARPRSATWRWVSKFIFCSLDLVRLKLNRTSDHWASDTILLSGPYFYDLSWGIFKLTLVGIASESKFMVLIWIS